ncbi:MAG: transposase [Pseudomonadota bacterium]|nr:transposase [Pseudomonadota bacterium]
MTIGKFIDRVLSENPRRQRALLGGHEAERKARAGDGTARPQLRLFDRVECDAHKLDARMIVMVPSPHGGYEPRKVHRLWVVAIIEVVSRAVLGYHLSLHRECGAEDVLRAVKSALTRWAPRELQFSGNAYMAEAGLPSHRHERYLGACWNEFSVDGALANICGRVERQLSEVVGSTVLKPQDPDSYSSRRSKDDRPFIESFFGRLAKGGFHRLSPTTGSSPKDKHGGNPDLIADATQFQLEYAEELLDTLIANYNITPHSGLGYRSPLAQLDFLSARQPGQIRHADAGEVRRMVSVRQLCTVLGGADSGRRPHFNFANARYSAEWLCLRHDLLGKNVWLHVEDEDDARYATVSTEQGLFLGAVRAAPPWHLTPHTLYMRQAIRALDKRRAIHLSSHCDAVEELIRYAESSADKKLPPHPAYLEARRVLQAHAEGLVGQSMVARAKQPALAPSIGPKRSPESVRGAGVASPLMSLPNAANVPARDSSPPPIAPGPLESRKLPRMRMAKTW